MIISNSIQCAFSYLAWTCFIVFCLSSVTAQAQWENVWAVGVNGGLDFNTDPASPYPTAMAGYGEACASICNAAGELLFYTEGSRVWDRNHNLMPNGNNLCPIYCNSFQTASTSQGALIVPLPDNPTLYYIFSLTAYECTSNSGRLYYSLVDMSLNDGLGAVVEGQKGVLVDTGLSERMTAVSGNDCNMWLLSVSKDNEFRAYEIFVSGTIAFPVITLLGEEESSILGKMTASPDRNYIAITDIRTTDIRLCIFDPSTGTVTEQMLMTALGGTYGASFSPDNSKLYVNEGINQTASSLYQFDVNSWDASLISSSRTLIGPVNMGIADIKRGPDQKLYYPYQASPSGVFMGVIHEPNMPGTACNNESEYIAFPPTMTISIGLPNVIPFISGGHDTISTAYADTLCFAAEAALPTPDSAANILWSNGSVAPELTVSASGTYWVQYNFPHSQCTLRVDTFNITLVNPELPELVTLASCANASNGKAYMDGPYVDEFSYAWKDASGVLLSQESILEGIGPGDYTVNIYTAGNCMTSINFSIAEIDESVAFEMDTIVCEGDQVSFVNESAAYYTHFTWHFGTGDSSLLPDPQYVYTTAGSYEVKLVGRGEQCSDTATASVIVDGPGAGYAFSLDRKEICTGESINLSTKVTGTDSTLEALYWHFGDGSYLQVSDANQPISHAYDSAGIMPIRLTAMFRACADSSFRDTVRVHAPPKVDLGPDTSLCLDGRPILLRNLQAAPAEAHHYLWNTGDTTASTQIVQPGRYQLKVSTAPLGCTTTDEIEVTKDCYTNIPNAFTPNGDGDNDYFFPRTQLSKSVNDFKMQVFNRWGQLVFVTTNIDGRGWDGRFNDKEQPVGVYIYLMEVGYSNGRQEEYKGNVTLIR